MDKWEKRTPEIAYLLNPPFCALVIYIAIFEYQKESKNDFPYPLSYLLLPMILHKETRERITSRTNMVVWLQRNPEVLVGFPERTRSLVPFTNEALEFLLNLKIVHTSYGKLSIAKTISKSRISRFTSNDEEIADCLKKSEHVGRWFARMGAERNIYAAWGVRP